MSQASRWIKKKWLLLVAALVSFAMAFASGLIADHMGRQLPVSIFGPLVLIFAWGNGFYWWLEFYWPDKAVPGSDPVEYRSRVSMAGPFYNSYIALFFGMYGLFALIATLIVVMHVVRG